MSFNVDRMVGALRKAQEHLRDSPELAEALAPALNSAFFLLDGHGPNFEDYLAAFSGTELPSLGAFASHEEFDAWLKTHFETPPRGSLSIAGGRYALGYTRAKGEPLLLRVPLVEELRRPVGGMNREQLWLALDKADAALTSSSEDLEGLHSATLALHFIETSGCAREFAWFLAHLHEPLPPLRRFATREEAESWLEHHPRPPHGAWVKAGEDALTVGYHRERKQRVLVRFPTGEDLDA
ncbi:MAG: hypothetical protein ABW123_26470 [Cystobacter sp.]